jgi:hypothetical protein
MATQAAGKPPDEGGEHGPVRPVHTWSRVGSPEDSDLMTQHEHLHLRGGGCAAQQQDQPPSTCRKIRYSNRGDTTVIVPERGARRSTLVNGRARHSGTPQAGGGGPGRRIRDAGVEDRLARNRWCVRESDLGWARAARPDSSPHPSRTPGRKDTVQRLPRGVRGAVGVVQRPSRVDLGLLGLRPCFRVPHPGAGALRSDQST